MKPNALVLGIALTALATAAVGQAAPPATGGGWTPLSRSSQKVYLVDPTAIRVAEGVSTVRIARVNVQRGAPDDFSYGVDEIELRCAADQSRATISVEFDSDAAETDRYEDPSPWETIRPGTLDASAKAIACEDATLNGAAWPTIRAYIEAGLP